MYRVYFNRIIKRKKYTTSFRQGKMLTHPSSCEFPKDRESFFKRCQAEMYSFEEIPLVWKYFFRAPWKIYCRNCCTKMKTASTMRCKINTQKRGQFLIDRFNVREKIRKHIYLKINCIILALECKNPPKMWKLDRLFDACCRRSQLKVGVWCALIVCKFVQLVFF
jgi:hypothetical protein